LPQKEDNKATHSTFGRDGFINSLYLRPITKR